MRQQLTYNAEWAPTGRAAGRLTAGGDPSSPQAWTLICLPVFACPEPDRWWRMTGSNRRPPACKAGALPAELIPRRTQPVWVVGLVGLEPTTPALSRRCSDQLSYRPLQRHTPHSKRKANPGRRTAHPAKPLNVGSRRLAPQPKVVCVCSVNSR